jgi:pseudouridine synthase
VGETPAEPGILRHWVASYFPVRDPAGAIAGVAAMVIEVTEERRAHVRAEEARRRSAFVDAELGALYSALPVGVAFLDPDLRYPRVNETLAGLNGRTVAAHVGASLRDVLGEAAAGLIAVGRLDFATSGLLLLTNDTQLGERLTNPSHAVRRSYVVTVRGGVSDEECARLEAGVEGLRADRVKVLKRSRRETRLEVDLREGRNREIRRLFAAIRHEVTRLLRVSFGPIALGNLKPGEWRELAREDFKGSW